MIWLLLLASIEAHLDCSDLRQGLGRFSVLKLKLMIVNLWPPEGQYTCTEPLILNSTQEYENCQKSRTVKLTCQPLANLTCRLSSGEVKVFNGSETARDLVKTLPCRWTNGKSYTISCLLSLFLGVFGIDRFYLGYPVLGIIKLSTVGMLGIGALSDFLLILLQVHFTTHFMA